MRRLSARGFSALLVAALAGCQLSYVRPVQQDGTPAPNEHPDQQPAGSNAPQANPSPQPSVPSDTPALTIADVSGSEGDGLLTFTVTLNRASSAPVTVDYSTADGTAAAGSDYREASGRLTFPAGAIAARSVPVALLDDAIDEAAETFLVRLSDVSGATVAVAAATATIIDNDRLSIMIEPQRLNVAEGGEGTYTVALGARPATPVTVSIAPAENLSVDPETLLFSPSAGTAAQTVTVSAAQDNDATADAPVELVHTVSGGGFLGVAPTVVVTIVEDDVSSLAVAEVRAVEGAEVLRFEVSLSLAGGAEVTVDFATRASDGTATEGIDYTRTTGMLRFPGGSTGARMIEIPVADDALDEADERVAVMLSNPHRAVLAGGGTTATATGTIVDDDDPPLVSIADSSANEDDGSIRFLVSLNQPSGRTVTVNYATRDDTAAAGTDYTAAGGTLTFAAGTTEHTVTVAIARDMANEPDERFQVALSSAVHATRAAGGATATGMIVDDDDPPAVSIMDAAANEGDAHIPFVVSLDRPSGATVTVRHATGDDTAAAGDDYTSVTGTLTFPAGTTTLNLPVPVVDDDVAEDDETFTVTLSEPAGATLASESATGSIADDDQRGVRVSPAALVLYEGSGALTYTLVLASQPTAQVTVAVATDPAVGSISATPTELTLTAADWAVAQTVTVTADADVMDGDSVTIRHTVSGGDYQGEPAGAVPVSYVENPSLELASLQVSGGGTMYPAFAGHVHHYALKCRNAAALQVTARAVHTDAQLALRRDNPELDEQSTANLDTQVTADNDHDIAITLSRADDSVTYVVHCLPQSFPDIRIVHRTDEVSDGLLFLTPKGANSFTGLMAIVDNNGVTRFHRGFSGVAWNFRRHDNGPLIDGRRVWYSVAETEQKTDIKLLDRNLEQIRAVRTVAPLTRTDYHDFLFTDTGNLLFTAYEPETRDLSDFQNSIGVPYSSHEPVLDSYIQEVTPGGESVFLWNSWDHLKLAPDCQARSLTWDYAHVNSLALADGDIVASFLGCAQILRIDRSSGTGAVEWQLGGTSPPRNAETEYLEIVDDDAGEFCGQHQPVLNDAGSIILFDNGSYCLGERKSRKPFSRVVEYDISDGDEAVFVREYRRPAGQGQSSLLGGVQVLENGHWLIAWGTTTGATADFQKIIAVSEVQPQTGTAVFEMHMSNDGQLFEAYRVYREPENEIEIPLNLP